MRLEGGEFRVPGFMSRPVQGVVHGVNVIEMHKRHGAP